MSARRRLLDPADVSRLPEIPAAEVARHTADGDIWVSVLGVVVVARAAFHALLDVNRGRDITTRSLLLLHGVSMDDHDDGCDAIPIHSSPGITLFPQRSPALSAAGRADRGGVGVHGVLAGPLPLRRVSDDGVENVGRVVGRLKEWADQQRSGQTAFRISRN